MGNTLGLIIELGIFFLAIYLYLYSSGMLNAKRFRDPKEVETFRKETGRWLRPLSLLLAAVMFINLSIRFFGS